jgi:hypothetical protein
VGSGLKYPYNFFWGGLSPRVSAAWNPRSDSGLMGHLFGNGKTVLRIGYGREYGRQNGVDLVLVPLLGPGLLQSVNCKGPLAATAVCAGTSSTDPTNAFRIGTDANPATLYQQGITNTLPQPFFPGLNGAAKASTSQVLDPKYKPSTSDSWDLSIQRDLGHNTILEVGYIGRRINNEYGNVSLDAVPWQLTQGGQSFAAAYAAIEKATGFGSAFPANADTITPQPFFETALGGAASPYCSSVNPKTGNPFVSCTAAVVSKQSSNLAGQQVMDLWNGLDKAGLIINGVATSCSTFARCQASSIQMPGSFGQGNYNAMVVSLSQRNWHGLTMNANYTWARALGTQFFGQANNGIFPPNAYDFKNWGSYGPQGLYDTRHIFNLQAIYQAPWFKGQQGILGRLLGGWSLAPFLTIRSGAPLAVITNGSETFGSPAGGQTSSAVLVSGSAQPTSGSLFQFTSSTYPAGLVGSDNNAANGGSLQNMFKNPTAVFNMYRPAILGLDPPNGNPGGDLRGLSSWQLDATLTKEIRFTERFNLKLYLSAVNVFNHPIFFDPSLNLQSPSSFGVIFGQANSPRTVQIGAKLSF